LKEASGRTRERKNAATKRSFGHGDKEAPGNRTSAIEPSEGQKTSGRDVARRTAPSIRRGRTGNKTRVKACELQDDQGIGHVQKRRQKRPEHPMRKHGRHRGPTLQGKNPRGNRRSGAKGHERLAEKEVNLLCAGMKRNTSRTRTSRLKVEEGEATHTPLRCTP
jgi:hypothetical protein